MELAANLFAALLVLLAAQTASAQSSYPNRPVKILVGFTPGTAPDLAARILAAGKVLDHERRAPDFRKPVGYSS